MRASWRALAYRRDDRARQLALLAPHAPVPPSCCRRRRCRRRRCRSATACLHATARATYPRISPRERERERESIHTPGGLFSSFRLCCVFSRTGIVRVDSLSSFSSVCFPFPISSRLSASSNASSYALLRALCFTRERERETRRRKSTERSPRGNDRVYATNRGVDREVTFRATAERVSIELLLAFLFISPSCLEDE